jgi:hypothetical protein
VSWQSSPWLLQPAESSEEPLASSMASGAGDASGEAAPEAASSLLQLHGSVSTPFSSTSPFWQLLRQLAQNSFFW